MAMMIEGGDFSSDSSYYKRLYESEKMKKKELTKEVEKLKLEVQSKDELINKLTENKSEVLF